MPEVGADQVAVTPVKEIFETASAVAGWQGAAVSPLMIILPIVLVLAPATGAAGSGLVTSFEIANTLFKLLPVKVVP